MLNINCGKVRVEARKQDRAIEIVPGRSDTDSIRVLTGVLRKSIAHSGYISKVEHI